MVLTELSNPSPFELEVERVRLAAVCAIARATDQASEPIERRLRELELRSRDIDSSRGLEYLLGLRADEIRFLWATVGATIDPELALHLPHLGPRYGRTGLSLAQFAMMAQLEPATLRELGRALLGASPLVRHRLIEPIDPRAVSSETAWVACARVVSFLAGDDALDPLIAQAGGLVTVPERLVTDARFDELRAQIREALAGPSCAIVIRGRHHAGRRTLAAAAAEVPVVALDLDRLKSSVALADAFAALGREASLRSAIPLIAGVEVLASTDAAAGRRELVRFVESSSSSVLLVTSSALPGMEVSRPVFRFDVALPAPSTRAALWRRELGQDDAARIEQDVQRCAFQFQLAPGGIRDAVAAARAIAMSQGRSIGGDDLVAGVQSTVEEHLHGLARRHTTRLTWDDMVLPEEIKAQVDLLVSRVRNAYQVLDTWGFQRHLPGSGVAALFSGPPGTGKTMLASIIARTLGLELFRVDLAQITSKWIGETEKQLDRVFDAAEVGHAMLLFDEADSLFAKRTEVRGATERYANMEVNFLLQRIESFAGVAILTTNMDGSLDPAFRRRLAAHIRFPQPDADERLELWRRLLPKSAPLAGDIDFEELAREFSSFAGAQIRNALTTAAFLAAARGVAIDQALLRHAAADEAQAMGRVVTSAS